MMNPNIATFLGCDTPYDQAGMVVFGAPFDGTTSFRPGTRFGPSAIRNESFGIETYSPYCDKDLTDCAIFDSGDLDFPFGNPVRVLDEIQCTVAEILADGKRPLMLGGEHLITLGAVRAMVSKYPDLHIIHLDAHTDLRDEYLGETLTHAGVIKQAWHLVGDEKSINLAFAVGKKQSLTLPKPTPICANSTWKALPKPWKRSKESPCISP